MKKLIGILLLTIATLSCTNTPKEQLQLNEIAKSINDTLVLVSGDTSIIIATTSLVKGEQELTTMFIEFSTIGDPFAIIILQYREPYGWDILTYDEMENMDFERIYRNYNYDKIDEIIKQKIEIASTMLKEKGGFK